MARLEAMVQRLLERPLVLVDGCVLNRPTVECPPRVARNRPYVDISDDDSEEEFVGIPKNQQQGRNQPDYRIRADIPLFHDKLQIEEFLD